MSTGDIRNNENRLLSCLKSIRFEDPIDEEKLKSGEPNAFIGLLQYALLEFSRHVAQFISEMGYELLGKSDSKFMENVYKFARNHFNYRPTLNLAQFFSTGFAERKMILVADIIGFVKTKHDELKKNEEAKKKIFSDPSRLLTTNRGIENEENLQTTKAIPIPKALPKATLKLLPKPPPKAEYTIGSLEGGRVLQFQPHIHAEQVVASSNQTWYAPSSDLPDPTPDNDYFIEEGDLQEPEDFGTIEPQPEPKRETKDTAVSPFPSTPVAKLDQNNRQTTTDIADLFSRLESFEKKVETSLEMLLAKFILLDGKVKHLEELMSHKPSTPYSSPPETKPPVSLSSPHTRNPPTDSNGNMEELSPKNYMCTTFLTTLDNSQPPSKTADIVANLSRRFKETQALLRGSRASRSPSNPEWMNREPAHIWKSNIEY